MTRRRRNRRSPASTAPAETPAETPASANHATETVAGPESALSGDMDVGGTHVVESSEAGGYYCEHTLYAGLQAASQPGSSIAAGDGGALVGFLHAPDDAATYSDAEVVDQAARHEQTRRVVGAALRGYFDQISLRGGVADGEPYRILITGYGRFMSQIRNNPTGDFVAHEENVTASMQLAFGPALVGGPERVNTEQTDRFLQRAQGGGGAEVAEYYTATWRYQVQEPATLETRDVLVTALRLPVTDQAIDPTQPGSLQDAIAEFGPQAVLSMGVVPDGNFTDHTYRAETRADDENLRADRGRLSHGSQDPTQEFGSRALVNAIRDGAQHQPSPGP